MLVAHHAGVASLRQEAKRHRHRFFGDPAQNRNLADSGSLLIDDPQHVGANGQRQFGFMFKLDRKGQQYPCQQCR